jgi:hypothetical protein
LLLLTGNTAQAIQLLASFLNLCSIMFKKASILLIVVLSALAGRAQSVDSIFFHLYTDSLKKGVHNYINVDGKLSNGQWRPLTAKDITFSTSYGVFDGNSLIIDSAFKGEKVMVKAVLKSNPALWREVTIYMKKIETPERLKTIDEVLNRPPGSDRRRNRRNQQL